jgi:hypothetical protein
VGGSHAYADTKTGTTFALTKNRLAPNFDTAEHVAEIITKGGSRQLTGRTENIDP